MNYENGKKVRGLFPWIAAAVVIAGLGFILSPKAKASTPVAVVPTVTVQTTVSPQQQATDPTEVVEGTVSTVKDPMVIGRDDKYEEVLSAEKVGTFQPIWPEGTNQTSVGYSNLEEFPDGRTFMTRSQTNPDEIMAFVAKCISINNGPKYCHKDTSGALTGLIIGHPDGEYPVKVWEGELKTLTIPGGLVNWKAYLNELSDFISANKKGAPVEILGSVAK